jgi:hypothetical protein
VTVRVTLSSLTGPRMVGGKESACALASRGDWMSTEANGFLTCCDKQGDVSNDDFGSPRAFEETTTLGEEAK